jgi:hypothetical protein
MKKVLLHLIIVLTFACAFDAIFLLITTHTLNTHASPSASFNRQNTSQSEGDEGDEGDEGGSSSNTVLNSSTVNSVSVVFTAFCNSEKLQASNLPKCKSLATQLEATFKLFESSTLKTPQNVQDAWLGGKPLSALANKATKTVSETGWITALENAGGNKTFIEANKGTGSLLDKLFRLKVTNLKAR